MKSVYRFALLFLVMGMAYSQLELFWKGYTNLPMTFIGGTAGSLIGALDSHRAKNNDKLWPVYLVGLIIILDLEFISGSIFNLYFHMNLWDYSRDFMNLDGQICLPYALLWLALIPGTVWLNELLRWKLFDEPVPPGLWYYYKSLFAFK